MKDSLTLYSNIDDLNYKNKESTISVLIHIGVRFNDLNKKIESQQSSKSLLTLSFCNFSTQGSIDILVFEQHVIIPFSILVRIDIWLPLDW